MEAAPIHASGLRTRIAELHFPTSCFRNGRYTKGGGICCVRGWTTDNVPGVTNCVFVNCTATNGQGGAVFSSHLSSTFQSCVFSNCTSTAAGGAVSFAEAQGTTLDIPDAYDEEPKFDGKLNLAVDTVSFHTFGLLWEPDGYSVFVDGRFRGRNATAVWHIPEFILLTTEAKWYRNNRMTGRGVPELSAAAQAGDDFVVDYVRVYDVEE